MEPDTKSRRCNTTSPAKENVVDDEDRLSSLPNHIAHNILSFLSIEDIAYLSLTSKKCEKFCLSVPSLNINDSELSFPKHSAKRTQFLDFLVNFMKGHRGEKMWKLHIRWYAEKLKCNEKSRIMWLLNHAAECDVHELDLNLYLEDEVVFVMPLDVFCCESLRSLRIDLRCGVLEFPSPRGFAHLRSLEIINLKIHGDSLGEIISSVCKFVEKLSLQKLRGIKKFKIASTSLLELVIKHCSLEHLEIYAPNLLCLEYKGNLCDYSFVEKLSLLQTAHLSLYKSNSKEIKLNRLNSLLSNIVQVSSLRINSFAIESLYGKGCLPIIFSNLQALELNQENSALTDLLPEITTSFLQGLPCNLKKLHLRIAAPDCSSHFESSYAYQTKFWVSQNLRFVQGLEEVDINLLRGRFEEGLLEYLLENAKQLKKMTITFGSSMPSTIVCKLIAVAISRGGGFCFKEQRMREKTMVIELDQALNLNS